MLHKEFIEKMARYKPVYDWIAENGDVPWKNLGQKFGMTPQHAAKAVQFYREHKDEPQHLAMGENTHYSVCQLTDWGIDLSSTESLRKGLVGRFRAKSTDEPGMNYKHTIFKSDLIKMLKASGLRWGMLGDQPVVHWSEKA